MGSLVESCAVAQVAQFSWVATDGSGSRCTRPICPQSPVVIRVRDNSQVVCHVQGTDLYRELTALIAALERAHLPYAVCGALAVAIHGAPRATKDIDILVPPEAIPAVLGAAKGSTMVDMSPEAIDARLREACALSDALEGPGPQAVSMSAEAITQRLREWAELTRMCLLLGRSTLSPDMPREPLPPTRDRAPTRSSQG
jgi:hypothetical protein